MRELSFRTKILACFVGLVLLMLMFLLGALRFETSRQIDQAVAAATERSQQAFADIEAMWVEDLERLNLRLIESNRMPGAMEAALEEDAPDILFDAAQYELKLAGISSSLVVFADADGEPMIAMIDGAKIEWRRELTGIDDLLESDYLNFCYLAVDDRLFAVTTAPMDLFGNVIGSVMLGSPVDHEVGEKLGQAVGAEVVFVVGGQALIATSGVREFGLMKHMLLMSARPGGSRLIDKQWALFTESLSHTQPGEGSRVIAIPLKDTVAPFDRLERVVSLVGIAALGIALLLGIVISSGLVAPIRVLMKATDRVAEGDFDFEVEVTSKDELGLLAKAFNGMVHGLFLKEKYRSVLNKVVSHDVAEEMLKGDVALGGENREVTVLFADIRGFTSLTEGMEPQEVIMMLNEFMDRAASAVDREGGVVDKYVGDEIMAIFGAPVHRGDDAARAVRAAIGIRASAEELNLIRQGRGQLPLRLGIGINTGEVVAGNMGSKDRLNYTVLGESVNLAARLCSKALPGQILISEGTLDEVKVGGVNAMEILPLDPIEVKGFSQPVEVFEVKDLKKETGQGRRSESMPAKGTSSGSVITGLVFGFAVMFGAGMVSAQNWLSDPPTLLDKGVGYVSENGGFQLDLSGRMLLEGYFPEDDPAYLISDTDRFFAAELSIFADLFFGEHVYVLTELRLDRGEAPIKDNWETRIEQAFVRYTPWSSGVFNLQLGKFVTPFGAYGQRHDTPADPFIRPPLNYDYRTMICPDIAPPSARAFVSWKYNEDIFRPTGAPVVWANPYQVGFMAFGGGGGFSYRLAVMNSAPSSGPDEWNAWIGEDIDPSYVAHLAYRLIPELEIGLSYNIGPYLLPEIEADLPWDASVNDYDQEIWGFDFAFVRGWTEIRGEFMYDIWQVPNVDEDVIDVSYFIEVKQKLGYGFYIAARYNSLEFNELTDLGGNDGNKTSDYGGESGEPEAWDWDLVRYQMSLGYRINRRMEIRGEYMINRTDGPRDPDDNLASIQFRWEF